MFGVTVRGLSVNVVGNWLKIIDGPGAVDDDTGVTVLSLDLARDGLLPRLCAISDRGRVYLIV